MAQAAHSSPASRVRPFRAPSSGHGLKIGSERCGVEVGEVQVRAGGRASGRSVRRFGWGGFRGAGGCEYAPASCTRPLCESDIWVVGGDEVDQK